MKNIEPLSLVAALLFIIWYLTAPAVKAADRPDWSVAVTLASYHHPGRTFECNGLERDWNEDNPGLFVRYKNLVVGRYENSQSGCNSIKHSTVIGVEPYLGRKWGIDWSVTAAVADGYGRSGSTDNDGYKGWASLNARVGPIKVWYSYYVTAIGLQVDF